MSDTNASAASPGSPGFHGRPTASEIVESVREWLDRDVFPHVEGRLKFHARVAVNALLIVERELAIGAEQEIEAAARLAAFGVADEAGLAARIRAGELEDRYDEVKAAVWANVRAKLAVANPKYVG